VMIAFEEEEEIKRKKPKQKKIQSDQKKNE
jgi:hypothetical protein